MLELRPSCECCDKDLPPDSTEARICTFECTFCATCATDKLKLICPNCGGDLVQRPRRPAAPPASSNAIRLPPSGYTTRLVAQALPPDDVVT